MIRRFSIYALFALLFIPQTSFPMADWLVSNVLEKAIKKSGIVERLARPAVSGVFVFFGTAALLKLGNKTKITPQISRIGRLGISTTLGVLTMHYLTDGALWNELIEFRKENNKLFKELSEEMNKNQMKNDNNFETLKNSTAIILENINNMQKDIGNIKEDINLLHKKEKEEEEEENKKKNNNHQVYMNNGSF